MKPGHTSHHLLYDSPMPTRWVRCRHDEWCPLNAVKLDHPHFDDMEGVYMIWHGGETPAVVAVGQGRIRSELAAAKRDPAIQAYRHLRLYATWARVAARYREGVAAYLVEHYAPRVSHSVPDVEPIPVELP